MSFILVPILIAAAVLLHFLIRKTYNSYQKDARAFINREQNANFARRKELDPDLYVQPDLSALPVAEEEPIAIVGDAQEKVIKRSASPMMRVPKAMTNTDLKLAFGVANLETIIQYETNYQKYIVSLIDWAQLCAAHGRYAQAAQICEAANTMGSEYSKSYLILAECYYKANDLSALRALTYRLETDESLPLPKPVRTKALKQIEDMKAEG